MKCPGIGLPYPRRPRSAAALVVLVCGMAAGCIDPPCYPVRTSWLGERAVCVDSVWAQRLLAQENPAADPAQEPVQTNESISLEQTSYAVLAQRYSLDYASLKLITRLRMEPGNTNIQAAFERAQARIRVAIQVRRLRTLFDPYTHYRLLFAPGWLYRREPGTGADFADTRRWLNEAGLTATLIETDENGSVEDNAQSVRSAIERHAEEMQPIILISTSKSGPEALSALGDLHRNATAGPVRAWLNIGGVLRGSPLADFALRWPVSWYVRFGMLDGEPLAGIESLATARRRDMQALPEHLLVVNYIGIPLSGTVSGAALAGYRLLANHGPNDGLTPILDAIAPRSMTLVEPGLDHYFLDPELRIKVLALALVLFERLSF